MKGTKLRYKLTAALLSAALLIQMVSVSAFATGTGTAEPPVPEEEQASNPAPEIIMEDESKRSETEKHFLLNDGSYVVASYNQPVHYLQDEKWEDINSNLTENNQAFSEEQEAEDSLEGFENKQGKFKVKFAKKAKANNLLHLKKDGYQIKWGIADTIENNASAEIVNDITTEEDKGQENAQWFNLSNLSSQVTYKNYLADTDLQYVVTGSGIKENIIVKKAQNSYSYSFHLKLKDLGARKTEAGSIELYDVNNTEKVVFTIPAPYMYDAEGNISEQVSYNLGQTNGGKYQLTVTADAAWINEPGRAFPVTIDPQICDPTVNNNAVVDQYCNNHISGRSAHEPAYLKVGYDSKCGNSMALIKFPDIPQMITETSVITNAVLRLNVRSKAYAGSSSWKMLAYEVTENWTQYGITWATAPTHSSRPLDYIDVSTTMETYPKFDITELVRKWRADTSTNYGIALRAQNFNTNGYIKFAATTGEYSATPECYPAMIISYRDNKGLEDYWSYSSHDIDGMATGYVNLYNGNLILQQTCLATTGNRMPMAYIRTHNKVGDTQWQSNFDQTLEAVNIPQADGTSPKFYKYIDGDGSTHYFYKSGSKWIDEDGLNLEITAATNSDPELKDQGGNVLVFDRISNLLKAMRDNNGNQITIERDNRHRVTKVTDGAERNMQIAYESASSDYVSQLTDPAGRIVSFITSDSGNTITEEITYPDGVKTVICYTGSRLTKIRHGSGTGIQYTYDSIGRVTQIAQYTGSESQPVMGQIQKITYNNDNTTTVTSSGQDDIINTADDLKAQYYFDEYGRSVLVTDGTGERKSFNSQALELTSGSAANGKKDNNRLQASVVTGSKIINLVKNHGFENSGSDWQQYNTTATEASRTYASDSVTCFGGYCMKVQFLAAAAQDKGLSQNLGSLPAGEYVFSAWVKGGSESAVMKAVVTNPAGQQQTTSINPYSVTGPSGDWVRSEIQVSVPEGNQGVTIMLGIAQGKSGQVFFDNVQFETGKWSGKYNLLENMDFRNGTAYWTAANTESGDGISGSGNNASYKLTGNLSKAKSVSQTISLQNPNKNDVYMVSCWGKADSLTTFNNQRRYALEVKVEYEDFQTRTKLIPFRAETASWQYTAGIVILKNLRDTNIKPRYITVTALYENNVGTAYFSDLQLIKEETPYYKYDEEGNLITNEKPEDKSVSFEYDDNGNVTRATDAKGYVSKATYDAKNNITSETNQRNIKNEYDYDSYGNITNQLTYDSIHTYYIPQTNTYTSNGNYLASSKDSRGNTTTYNYNPTKGTLTSVTNAKGTTIANGYNANNDRLTETYMATEAGYKAFRTAYDYDDIGNVTEITSPRATYNVGYNAFGNISSIDVDGHTIAEYFYNANNGKLTEQYYGDGTDIEYGYDAKERLNQLKINGKLKAEYEYDDAGRLREYKEGSSLKEQYHYDLQERLDGKVVKRSGMQDITMRYGFDANQNVTNVTYTQGNTTQSTVNVYEAADLLTSSTINGGNAKIENEYDDMGRLKKRKITQGSNMVMLEYSYYEGTTVSGKPGFASTSLVKWVKLKDANENVLNTTSYEYDTVGNITKITENGEEKLSYTYDDLGQLTRENNKYQNKSITYGYDEGGNITYKYEYAYSTGKLGTRQKAVNYTYGNGSTAWKQQLTKYDDKSITYNEIGNPVSVGTASLTWSNGKQLTRIMDVQGNFAGGGQVSFSYDAQGRRTSITQQDGQQHKFVYDGDRLLCEILQANGNPKELWFLYDGNGQCVGLQYQNQTYTFVKNIQGDVTQLRQGNTVVANYTYDAWGKLLSVTDANGAAITNASHIANINPIRYRSYFYDVQTGFYYLKTRYYNPEWGRFLNADSQFDSNAGVIGYNLYVYCANNPTNYDDPDGRFIRLSDTTVQIQSGDTLWGISAALTGNGANWTKIGYTGNPNRLQVGQVIDISGLYNVMLTSKKPNFVPRKDKKKGSENRQPTGDRERNVGHPDGEEHSRVPKGNGIRRTNYFETPLPVLRPPSPQKSPGNSTVGQGIAVGIGTAGVGYLFYRGIRMLPSLFPALWFTLPANVLAP